MTSTKISSEESSGGIAYFIKKGIIGILNIVKGVGIMISNGRIIISVTFKKIPSYNFQGLSTFIYFFEIQIKILAKLDYFQPIK